MEAEKAMSTTSAHESGGRVMLRDRARLALVVLACVAAACDRYHVCDPPADRLLSRLPARLSETGLYADLAAGTVSPEVLPFQPQFALWSDGAAKRRWIRLPPGTRIDTSDMARVEQPAGAQVDEAAWGNPELYGEHQRIFGAPDRLHLRSAARLGLGLLLAEHGPASSLMENRALAIADALDAARPRPPLRHDAGEPRTTGQPSTVILPGVRQTPRVAASLALSPCARGPAPARAARAAPPASARR